jgi:hypothetical protein
MRSACSLHYAEIVVLACLSEKHTTLCWEVGHDIDCCPARTLFSRSIYPLIGLRCAKLYLEDRDWLEISVMALRQRERLALQMKFILTNTL